MTISEAVEIYLKNYPGDNKEEFFSIVDAEADRDAVRALLDETTKISIEWGDKSLIEIGQEVENTLHERHPELSPKALERLGNYFTYLIK